MLQNFASILILFLGFVGVSTVDALRCQCTTDKGGVPCYNSWCQVYNNGTKVAACAMIRIGSIQHFACAHVSKDSTDSCKVVQKNGRDATKCWCRNEDYCNVELAERVDDDSPRHQQKTWESESSDVDQHDAPDMIIDKQYDVNDQVDEGDLSDEIDNQEVASNRIEENTFDMRPPELPKPSIDESIPPWRRRNPAAQEVVTPPPLPPLPGSHQRKITTTTTTTTTTTPRTPSPEEQRRLYEEEWRRRHLEHENRRKKFEEEEEKRRQTHIQQQKLQYEATRRFAESSRGTENWPVPSQERSKSSEVGRVETSRTQRIEARIQSQDRSRSLQQRPETREDTPRSYVPNTETKREQELAKSVSNVEPTTTLRVGLTRNNSVDRIITYSEIRDRFKKPEDSIQPKKDEIVYPPGALRHAAKPLSTTTTTTTSTIPTTTTTTSTTTTPSTSTTTTTTTTARTSTTTTTPSTTSTPTPSTTSTPTPSTTSTPTTTKTTVYRNSDESEEDDGEILFTTKKPVLKLKNVSSNDNEVPLPKSSAKIGGSIIVTLLFCIFVLSRGF